MLRWIPLIVIIVGLSFASPVFCVDPNRLISQYAHTAWRVQDGFEVGTTIAQTPDGYLWFGTSTGLLRFDGVRFTPYELPLIDPPVRGFNYLLAGRDGSLWIGTRIGLARLKDGKLQWLSDTAENSGITAILEDPEGTIWLTRYYVPKGKGPLCRVEGSGLHCYGEADGIRVRYGLGLTRDDEGNLWFGSSVLNKWHPGSPATTYLEQIGKRPDAGEGIVDVAAGTGGTIWATTPVAGPGMGVLWFSKGKWANYVVPGLDGSTVGSQTLFMDREHTLWIGTQGDGLYRTHGGVAEHYGVADGLSGRDISLIFEDHEGNIWVITDGGIDMFRDTAVVSYTDREGLSGNSVYSVLALRDGSLWIANANRIDILKDGRHSALPAKGRFDERVGALFEDTHGVVWIGRYNKLFSYTQGNYREIKRPDGSTLEYGPIVAITEDSKADIWILSERHDLLRIANGHATKVLKTTDSNRTGGGLAADHSGGLWIASKTDTFTYYKDGAVRTVSLNNPESSFSVFDISVDSDDALIVASSQGLFRWDGKLWRGLDSRDGFPGNTVFSFLRGDDNAVWVRCRQGLVRIPESEFDKWRRSGSKPVMTVFDRLDGARPIGLPFMIQPSAARTADGRLWFAAHTTLQMIDPKRTFRNPIPPPVYVEKIVADRRDYGLKEGLELPSLTRDIRIDYTALSVTVPQKVSFRYRLENHDAGWQDAGTRREAFYNDLPPGNYRFRVIASNNSGVWNEEGAALDFTILPAYYQTIWFRALCVVASLALLCAAYRLRVGQLQEQEKKFREAVEAMPALAFVSLPDGSRTFVNKGWVEYTGLTVGQAVGSDWQAATHPEDLHRVLAKWRASLASGDPLEYETRLRRGAGGEYRWFLTRAVPIRDKRGKIVKWCGTATDIEDRKRAEQLQGELAHLNRVNTMGELTASLAHEINQPIGAAVTNAQACWRFLNREQPDVPVAREAALEMVRDATRAADIIDRVRSLYRKGSLRLEMVDVNEVIGEMVVILHDEAKRHSVDTHIKLCENLPSVLADRVQLRQVLMNLMMNGIEAMGGLGGELSIKSQLAEDGQLLISVSDTGVGLPTGKADEIFNAFFTTKPQGTGLGLAITRSIVESHGGRVWANTNSGRGATFQFTLPQKTAAHA